MSQVGLGQTLGAYAPWQVDDGLSTIPLRELNDLLFRLTKETEEFRPWLAVTNDDLLKNQVMALSTVLIDVAVERRMDQVIIGVW